MAAEILRVILSNSHRDFSILAIHSTFAVMMTPIQLHRQLARPRVDGLANNLGSP